MLSAGKFSTRSKLNWHANWLYITLWQYTGMSLLLCAPEGISLIGFHMVKGSVFSCTRRVILEFHKELYHTGWTEVFNTISYYTDPNHASHQAPALLFLWMKWKQSIRLRSTGLCKTSGSWHRLHHRLCARTVQHFFNSAHIVCVTLSGWVWRYSQI